MLTFSNPGELDPRLAQLFGVNVKTSESAIGHFGTGLKYAIAVTLRLGGTIRIWSGKKEFNFTTSQTTIRGKEFSLVTMHSLDDVVTMPFTLELGKDWAPWMVYRELWSNAQDEGGVTTEGLQAPTEGTTTIWVNCAQVLEAHKKRSEFILQSTPLETIPDQLELHRGSSNSIYYKGLKVFTTDKPGFFTYNILEPTDLTEDRTLRSWWLTQRLIIRRLGFSSHLRDVLLSGEAYWEWKTDWDQWPAWDGGVPAGVESTITTLAQTHRTKLPVSVRQIFLPKTIPPALVMSALMQAVLDRGLAFCKRIDHEIEHEVVVVDSLGAGTLGTVLDNKIVLSKECFSLGTKIVAGTLLEEHLHVKYGHQDCSRELQNYLVNLVVGLGEELKGEPL